MSVFVDESQLCAQAGAGGAGCVSFRREAHVSRGGPDGGDGGRGGDVWLTADRNVASLLAFRDHPHRRAESGTHGEGQRRHGADGDDLEVAVPEGTTVYDADHVMVADLARHGQRWKAAAGGRGGRGNARFMTNRRRAPSFAEQGEDGEERWLDFELRLMADVALVGLPNVGKSTLISRLSAARPKIADYPFTTLEPHLGVVSGPRGEFVMADIPGLIEGASAGRGLGHKFLRHIERARVLAVLVDLGEAGDVPAADQERILLAELADYRPDLIERPRLIVGSRADLVAGDAATDFSADLCISSVTGEGLDELVNRLATLVQAERDQAEDPDGEQGPDYVVHRPTPVGIAVRTEGPGHFVIDSPAARRAVALSDLTDPQALAYAQERLRDLGVDRALRRAGASEGDSVTIGEISFDFEADVL